MKTLRPSVLSVIFNYFQRAAPVKLRTIHIFNSAYWAPKLLQMVSPFIDSKIVEQIVFYPRNLSLEELRERCRLPLPSDLGGELPSVDVLQERLIEKMESISAYYEAEELQR
uniref:CRAL-TRIO domain-containing protein n=2 Tax=Photinus pyralis TaxID=7054 RepID=A0A1Y1NPB2_PHOPY